MHEVALMEEAVRVAVQAARASGGDRILKLRLRIGTMSGVVPEAMRFAFDVICRDTIAADATLEIDDVPATCWCAVCEREFPQTDFSNECPTCHNLSGKLCRGRELEIAAVEIS
jgi:hydrogenase nickel incorporation protein HypA/HybF